jgi:hypothetical protein
MKQFLFTLLFALPLVVSAQRNYEDVKIGPTTITNAGTATQDFLFLFKRPYFYSVQVSTSRTSGTAAGFAIIEQSNDPAPLYANKLWAPVDSIAITDVATQTAIREGLMEARYLRVRLVGSGTQVINVTTNATFKATNTP